jgi:hypothetical protein
LLLTSQPVGHHPLQSTARPVLVFAKQIDRRFRLAHALRGLERRVGSNVAALEPAIGENLQAVENLVLIPPEAACILLHRLRECGCRQKHALHGAQLLSHVHGFHTCIASIELIHCIPARIHAAV